MSENARSEYAFRPHHRHLEPGVEELSVRPRLFAVPAARAPSNKPMRILIADRDIRSTESLQLLLHALGYSATRIADSGEKALQIAGQFAPGIVLLELDLPDMSSYHVAELLRQRAQVRELRLIALTASRAHVGRELARAAGFERYLLKPVASFALEELLGMQRQ